MSCQNSCCGHCPADIKCPLGDAIPLSVLEVSNENIRRGVNTKSNDGYDPLYQSIEKIGIRQPLIVKMINGEPKIVDGGQRFRFASILDYENIACIIRQIDDEKETMFVSSDLNIHITSTLYQKCIEVKKLRRKGATDDELEEHSIKDINEISLLPESFLGAFAKLHNEWTPDDEDYLKSIFWKIPEHHNRTLCTKGTLQRLSKLFITYGLSEDNLKGIAKIIIKHKVCLNLFLDIVNRELKCEKFENAETTWEEAFEKPQLSKALLKIPYELYFSQVQINKIREIAARKHIKYEDLLQEIIDKWIDNEYASVMIPVQITL
jgi:hypothetical protein